MLGIVLGANDKKQAQPQSSLLLPCFVKLGWNLRVILSWYWKDSFDSRGCSGKIASK